MYKQGFVVAIRCNNEVLRESKGEVFLPFGSNYSIRLNNQNSRRALAEIYIDGMDAWGGNRIVIPANGSVDVERFCLDGSLDKGNKFMFVRAGDSRVQDLTSRDNGNIRVRFWLEKEINIQEYMQKIWDSYPYHPIHCGTLRYTTRGWGTGDPIIDDTWVGDPKYDPYITCSTMNMSNIGATVEGDVSSQKFGMVKIDDIEENYVEISLKLRGADRAVAVREGLFCRSCGKKVKVGDNYCFSCGSKL